MITDGPGVAFPTLLKEATDPLLRRLVGPATVDILEALDPRLAQGDRLKQIAVELLDPSEILRNADTRNRILALLSPNKVRELTARLGLIGEHQSEDMLRQATARASARSALFSFFGVAGDAVDEPETQADLLPVSAGYGLFPHQRAAAAKTSQLLCSEPRKAILHMPTGAGKTRTAMHIVVDHLKARPGTLVCWLAQNAELLEQAASEFEKAWKYSGDREIGILRYWGKWQTPPATLMDGIIVAGLGKLVALDKRDPMAMLCLSDRVSLTVIDEAHQAIAPTYASILSALYSKRPSNALLGLTATPGRTWSDIAEDRKLAEFFEGRKVMLEVSGYSNPVDFLIKEGYLARPRFTTLNSQAGLELTNKDIEDLSRSAEIPFGVLERLGSDAQRSLRVVAAVEDLLGRHRRVIVFAPSVASARLLAAVLLVRGADASIITGSTAPRERERIVRRFRSENRKPMILCNYGVLTTGFDAPSISAAVIARPTRSLVLYSQMVGRATRGTRAGGNAEAEIVTVADPHLPGFDSVANAFKNWEDIWNEPC